MRRLLVVGLAITLCGCSTQYKVAGYFEKSEEMFFGDVIVSTGDNGTINVSNLTKSFICSGSSWLIERPSGFTGLGGRAAAKAECNTGRKFSVEVVQNKERGGSGQGIDDQGEIVHVFFDVSESVARSDAQQSLLLTKKSMLTQPTPNVQTAPPRDTAGRLNELQGLKDQKLITDQEYKQRRKAILDGL